jgi:hypothetical protein
MHSVVGAIAMKSWRCPNCQSSTVLLGHLWNGEFVANRFVPTQTRSHGVGLKHHFRCCWSCGHIWASVDPEQLRACIEQHGNELVREQLQPFARDPYYGLPACPEAHEAAKGVAEIDGLVFEGKVIEAIRRYRELTHTKWGPAGDDIRAWHNLKRAKKLALFGWHSKDAITDDASLLKDPMRDRWLDR